MNTQIPSWLLDYRERLNKRRQVFYEREKLSYISVDAARKFRGNGEVNRFDGWSVVYFFPPQNELLSQIGVVTSKLRASLRDVGILSKFAFLPIETYHVTLVGIATNQTEQMSKEIVTRVNECFETFRSRQLPTPRMIIRGDVSPDGSTIILPIEPKDFQSIETLYYMREVIREKLHPLGEDIVRNTPRNFHGHISFAYMVHSFSKSEYSVFKKLFSSYLSENNLGELTINTLSLHHFKTMIDWGNPVLRMTLENS